MNSKIEDTIKENRPNISASSIKTYISILSNLWKKLNPNENTDSFDISFFTKNSKEILKHLEELKSSQRKTILASLISVCKNDECIEKYRSQMITDVSKYNKDMMKQEKDDKQSKNWLSMDEIHKTYKEVYDDSFSLLNKKELTNTQYYRIVDLIIISLLGGIYIPPRRLLDYCNFKIKEVQETDNFLKGRKLIFNTYKTAKTYGSQEVSIPPKLFSLLSRWIKINPTEYLIFDTNMKKFTPPRLTLRINKIFGKNISVNILRHVYISNYLKDVPLLDELNSKAEELGHSIDQMMLYRKK